MKTKFFTYAFLFFLLTSINANAHVWALTLNGGAFNQGAIIICNPDGSGLNVAHSFHSPAGFHPYGDLIMASDGNLYGTCFDGGLYGSCTIFRFDPGTQVYTDVADFDIVHGDFPRSGVVEGPNGKLYGAASSGGAAGGGVIYSYDMNTGVYADLVDLTSLTGTYPIGNPVYHNNGKLYGMTAAGGLYGSGTIYSYDIATDLYTDEYDFDGATGFSPHGSLCLAADGNYYGLTSSGGTNGAGVLFRFQPSEGIFTELYEFSAATGSIPEGTLMQASNGLLYGLTSAGGVHGEGVLFSYNLMNGVYTNLFNFNTTDGAVPQGKLIQSGSMLCGATSAGGTNGQGVMFNYELTNGTFTKVLDFDGSNGANPNGGFLEVNMTGTSEEQLSSHVSIYPVPVTDVLNVSFSSAQQSATVKILDVEGRLIYETLGGDIMGTKTIDMKAFAAGNYLLEISSGAEKFTSKIVKN